MPDKRYWHDFQSFFPKEKVRPIQKLQTSDYAMTMIIAQPIMSRTSEVSCKFLTGPHETALHAKVDPGVACSPQENDDNEDDGQNVGLEHERQNFVVQRHRKYKTTTLDISSKSSNMIQQQSSHANANITPLDKATLKTLHGCLRL